MKTQFVPRYYKWDRNIKKRQNVVFTGLKSPPKGEIESFLPAVKKLLAEISEVPGKVLSDIAELPEKLIEALDDSSAPVKKQIDSAVIKSAEKAKIPEPKAFWQSNDERSAYLMHLVRDYGQIEGNMPKILEIFGKENSKSKLTNNELGYLRSGISKMKPLKDNMINAFLDIYKNCVSSYNQFNKPEAGIHLRMLLIENPEAANIISAQTLIKSISEIERTGHEQADLSLLRILPTKIKDRFSQQEMKEIASQLQKTSDVLNERMNRPKETVNIEEITLPANQIIIIKPDNIQGKKVLQPKEIKPKTVKPEITFPKFESKYPLGSKEYFDERLNYLYRVWYEIAPKKDEEIFIKFMDMFDELNKTAKSTNLGPFTEFLELSAYFSSFEETMTNKLLDRFLDSYRRHIEDFDIKLYEKAIHGPTYLHELCNKYSKVATKDTIMKLLKEFERTGCDDYIEVRGMGDSSAMELYFKHLTPEEQKEITAESQRVARVLEERSKHAGELEKLKEKQPSS